MFCVFSALIYRLLGRSNAVQLLEICAQNKVIGCQSETTKAKHRTCQRCGRTGVLKSYGKVAQTGTPRRPSHWRPASRCVASGSTNGAPLPARFLQTATLGWIDVGGLTPLIPDPRRSQVVAIRFILDGPHLTSSHARLRCAVGPPGQKADLSLFERIVVRRNLDIPLTHVSLPSALPVATCAVLIPSL